jgi:hypothetical protein
MPSKTRSFRPSPALAIACVALFAALTGSAIAAGVAKNSVRSAQIVDGTVRTIDLRDSAVNSVKVVDQSLTANDLGPDSVNSEEIAENAVGTSEVAPDSLAAGDLAPNSVGTSEVADNTLTANDLGPDSVGASELAADSAGSSEIATDSVRSSELGPIVQRTSAPQAIAAGANGSVSIDCAAGEQVIGGGGQPANFGVEMASSRPQGNGWLYQARNNNGAASTITAHVLCLAN